VATTQDIQSWLAANPGASDQNIAQAMMQYGVTPDQMAQATGLNQNTVQQRFQNAGGVDVNGARSWLDQNLGGGYGANGQFQPGSVFNNGVYDTSNTQRNDMVLGKAQQMGYTPDQISQILGIPASQISAFQSNPQNAPLINSFASSFKTDASNPASYMTQSGVTNDQISGWLQSHPGASDSQIAQAMQQYGVTPGQMAGATGLGTQFVTDRYNAALNGTNGPQQLQQLAGGGQMTTQAFGPNGAPVGHGPHNGSMPLAGQGGTGMAMNPGASGGMLGGGAFGPAGGYGYFGTQGNPYLDGMAGNIMRQSNLGLNDAFNQIRSNDVSNGTLGGSRQGVAQGVAIGRAQDALQGNLANLYGGAFEGQQNRGLQQYGIDTNAYLGNQGQQLSFYNSQRQLDQNGAALGAQLYGMGQQGQWTPYQNAGSIYSGFGGYGTQTGQQSQGGGAMGAFGGALGGAQMYQNLSNQNGYGGYGLGLGGNYGLKF
jgi:hypothetical protein